MDEVTEGALDWAIEQAEDRAQFLSSDPEAEDIVQRLQRRAEVLRRLRDASSGREEMEKIGRFVIEWTDDDGMMAMEPDGRPGCLLCPARAPYGHADWCPIPGALRAAPTDREDEDE